MSMTEVIQEMSGRSFSEFMNAPVSCNGQAYIQKDYNTGILYVVCPYCGKRNLIIKEDTSISNLEIKCKSSSCKKLFMVNVKDGKEIERNMERY